MTEARHRQSDRSGIANRRPSGNSRPASGGPPLRAEADSVLTAIIVEGDAQTLVEQADSLGHELAEPLSTSQIRSLFAEVRQIEADWQHDSERAHRRLILLKPKMAYRARRESGQGVTRLVDVLRPCIDLVEGDSVRFRRFVEFFEAILAYHKAHGGR